MKWPLLRLGSSVACSFEQVAKRIFPRENGLHQAQLGKIGG